MNSIFLSYDKLEELLNDLDNKGLSAEQIEQLIWNAYHISTDNETLFRRHSYFDISQYVKNNSELFVIAGNLDILIYHKNGEHKVNTNIAMIAFKLRDHLKIEVVRHGHQRFVRNMQQLADENVTNANHNFKKADEKFNLAQEKFDLIETRLKEIDNLKKEAEESWNLGQLNLDEIQKIQSSITKEVLSIASILITILTFILGNVGIMEVVRDINFTGGREDIICLLIQANSLMIIGISVLMMIVAAFSHKKIIDGKFHETPKFLVPFTLIITFIFIFIISFL